jgi:hypothetical protein
MSSRYSLRSSMVIASGSSNSACASSDLPSNYLVLGPCGGLVRVEGGSGHRLTISSMETCRVPNTSRDQSIRIVTVFFATLTQ